MVLPHVEIKVKLEANWLRFACLVVPDIGVKAVIETSRFRRLAKGFNFETQQFDCGSGPIGLLIGLGQQAFQMQRIVCFQSTQFPQVGAY